jgi:DNA-binding NtrC family response regulator
VKQAQILVVDDDRGVLASLQYLLRSENYGVSCAESPAAALDALRTQDIDLALIDLNYSRDTTSGQEGLSLLASLLQLEPHLPVVVMTAWGNVDNAVATLKAGAVDFVQKPWENARLLSIVDNQLQRSAAEKRNRELREEVRLLKAGQQPAPQALAATSDVMRTLLAQLKQAAATDASILFTGENGTGKSLLALQVHQWSARAGQPFIGVNMGSITESLFESEMFGHVMGAFTDARETRIGRFELAGQGTLFLDEIANTPVSQQAKLLRVLEAKQFEKVGSSRSLRADCRLLSATNCDLERAVKDGHFRMDLLYRLNTLTFRVPALRERSEDILPLAEHFLQQSARKYGRPQPALSMAASWALQAYAWPGNVRELSHVVERALILSTGPEIDASDLGLEAQAGQESEAALGAFQGTLEELEQRVIRTRLAVHKGNVATAAKSLGLSRSAFYRRLEKEDRTG